jgi:hypothetical protein
MTSANRVQISTVKETTPGTTPVTPRMRKVRWTGEALTLFNPSYDDPNEITDDRMNTDAIMLFQESGGSINFNMSYPVNNSPLSDFYASAFYNDWTLTPERDNDGVADSVITDIGTVANTIACVTGASFVVGHLVQFSGNTNAGNNVIGRCTTGSATAPVFSGTTFTADATPAATSRMKAVGFAGIAGDITATSVGLASTTLDFTTFGLVPGQTFKIGGTAAGDKFATAANNAWVTVVSVAAHADHARQQAGWLGRRCRHRQNYQGLVWRQHQERHLTDATRVALTIEKGFLGQPVPSYIVGRGISVNTATSLKHKDKSAACLISWAWAARNPPPRSMPCPMPSPPAASCRQRQCRPACGRRLAAGLAEFLPLARVHHQQQPAADRGCDAGVSGRPQRGRVHRSMSSSRPTTAATACSPNSRRHRHLDS